MKTQEEVLEEWTELLEVLPGEREKWEAGLVAPTETIRLTHHEPTAPLPTLERLADVEPGAVIAKGGMGQIVLGHQRSIGREVALKAVRDDRDSARTRQELFEEGRVTGRLEHPNVIPVHGMGSDAQGSPVFAMRKVDGVSWVDTLGSGGQLPAFYAGMEPLEAHLEIFDQVCRAAHYAHTLGILHRDIKPDNVLLGPHGEVYLSDWGLAVALEGSEVGKGLARVADIREAVGTPVYMAPEMAVPRPDETGAWTDVYLLGATLHLIVTGTFRHIGGSAMAILVAAASSQPVRYDARVPAGLAEICNRATHAQPTARYASADALRRAVRAWRERSAVYRMLEQADRRCGELEALAAALAKDSASYETQSTYRLFGGALFGYEQAASLWPEGDAPVQGRARTLGAMFDISVSVGDLHAAASLLEMLEGPEPERAARLARAREEVEAESARVRALEDTRREYDPARDRRTLGLGALATVLVLGAVNAGYTLGFEVGILEVSTKTLVGLKLADTVIMQVSLIVMLTWKRVNTIMRQSLYVLIWTIWFSCAARLVGLTYGLELAYSSALESLFYALGVTAIGVFLDRRLVLLTPLFLGLIGVRLLMPEMGMPLRVFTNLLMLGMIGALMMQSLGAHKPTPT